MNASLTFTISLATLVAGLSIGYAVGFIEGLADRWLYHHVAVPLVRALTRENLEEFAIWVLILPILAVAVLLDPEGFRAQMRGVPRRDE